MSQKKSKTSLNKCDELIDRLTELKKVLNALSVPSSSKQSLNKGQYTPAQLAAIEEANKLKKNAERSPWISHNGVPNADAEVQKLKRTNPVSNGEDALANQLTKVMMGKNMLGLRPPPQLNQNDFIKAGEAMGLAPSEEQLQKAEHDWNNRFNWLQEAMKPISSRFNSPEEEEQYWASIKVADRDDGRSGY